MRQAESVLLEPWYSFTAEADAALAGRILSDIPLLWAAGMKAPVTSRDGRVAVTVHACGTDAGLCPGGADRWARDRARLSLAFGRHIIPVPAQQQYWPNKPALTGEDVENTPSRFVFATTEAGYPKIQMERGHRQMHIQLK